MLCAGDEFGRTQRGNNNAYAQDNEITWLNWQNRDIDLENFVADLASLRTKCIPTEATKFVQQARWLDLSGNEMTAEKWEDPGLHGFEVHITNMMGSVVVIRVSRKEKICTFQLAEQ